VSGTNKRISRSLCRFDSVRNTGTPEIHAGPARGGGGAHAVDDRLDLVAEVALEQEVDRHRAAVARDEALRRNPSRASRSGTRASAGSSARADAGTAGSSWRSPCASVRITGTVARLSTRRTPCRCASSLESTATRASSAGSNARSLSSATTRISSPPYVSTLSR
jgi:hypothetical protein